MTAICRMGFIGLVVAATASLLVACGNKEAEKAPAKVVNKKEAMPLARLTLKNTNPVGGHPATAEATGSKDGKTGRPLSTPPAEPEKSSSSPEMGPEDGMAADTVAITVTFLGGPDYHATASFPGSFIGSVEIECNESAGGNVTVNFADGQPTRTVPLGP